MLEVYMGSITDKEKTFLIDNMCIIVNTDVGYIHQYGDADHSNIKDHYNKMMDKYLKSSCPEFANDFKLICFDRYNGQLTIEEICTIVNYGLNSHGERFLDLFKLNIDDLKKRVKELQAINY